MLPAPEARDGAINRAIPKKLNYKLCTVPTVCMLKSHIYI